ncbi:hypothetical protein HMPREF1544_08503 [Mucor circinelloides 1006PhL]|uniref:Defect at low temperature protein 1 n=1 Tax=Mucor circinelloides f. circinelloides (strain 1006PhL) TaxID=1220926 RepID=S2J4Y2_MUCC1|nr:hypothetical protein HMPREF1544_08503 [Mucor circinelloides 1006PhL]
MKSVKLTQYLYTASLFFLIFLTAVCVAISAADVVIQALTDKTNTGQFDYRNLIVVGGSYLLLALASLLFSCSRMLTVRGSLQDIPKLYIPIKKEDLPKKVFHKIRYEFEQAKQTRKLAEPRSEDIQAVGWAKPGTPLFEGLDFKQAIARTPAIVEKIALSINPDFFRPLYVPVRQYIEFLMQQGLIDKQLGSFYLRGYEIARFSQEPLSQDQYMEIMKHLAAILQNMGYNIKNNSNVAARKSSHQTNNTNDSVSSDHKAARKSSSRRRLSSHKSIDSISVTQSIHTWTSRSTHTTNSKKHAILHGNNNSRESADELEDEDEDDYSAYDEDEVRNDIYELLMKDRASQHQI